MDTIITTALEALKLTSTLASLLALFLLLAALLGA